MCKKDVIPPFGFVDLISISSYAYSCSHTCDAAVSSHRFVFQIVANCVLSEVQLVSVNEM